MVVVLPGALDCCLRHPVLSQRGLLRSRLSLSGHNRSCGIADSVSRPACASDAVAGTFRQLDFQMTSVITRNGRFSPYRVSVRVIVLGGGLTLAVTNGIPSFEEDRHGAAREEASNTVSGYCPAASRRICPRQNCHETITCYSCDWAYVAVESRASLSSNKIKCRAVSPLWEGHRGMQKWRVEPRLSSCLSGGSAAKFPATTTTKITCYSCNQAYVAVESRGRVEVASVEQSSSSLDSPFVFSSPKFPPPSPARHATVQDE